MEKRKIVLYIAVSLDGYIATKEHKLDWLFSAEGDGDNGYSKFYETVDTVLMGRVTYDWIMEHEKSNFPYSGKECYVFTTEERMNNDYVKFINPDINIFMKELVNINGKNIWLVGGGNLINSFINENLVDEIIITIFPILLGNGINLFNETEHQTKLLLKNINRYNQIVELQYTVIGDNYGL